MPVGSWLRSVRTFSCPGRDNCRYPCSITYFDVRDLWPHSRHELEVRAAGVSRHRRISSWLGWAGISAARPDRQRWPHRSCRNRSISKPGDRATFLGFGAGCLRLCRAQRWRLVAAVRNGDGRKVDFPARGCPTPARWTGQSATTWTNPTTIPNSKHAPLMGDHHRSRSL